MDRVQERISAWEAAGLIDPATAARLRLAEADALEDDPDAGPVVAEPPSSRPAPSSFGSVFGPSLSIGEMFGYVGGAFLLGAYETFVIRVAGFGEGSQLLLTIAWAAAAAALIVAGLTLMDGDARRRRAAGVLFAIAVLHAGAAGAALAAAAAWNWPAPSVLGAVVATFTAIGLRRLHASMMTQLALLVSLTVLAAVVLDWLNQVLVPPTEFTNDGLPIDGGPDPILRVVLAALWWIVLAVLIGAIGLLEADSAEGDPAAGRRADFSRLWAGLVAVFGVASALTMTSFDSSGGFGRTLQPWVGDLVLLIVAAVLVERAFRRDASVFVYAAAVGLIIALSDFNFTYLADSTEVGLLIEGVILLGAGFGANRLRQRVVPLQPAPALS